MRKRRWVVELEAQPKADGHQRLGRVVQLIVDRAAQPVVMPGNHSLSDADVGDDLHGEEEVGL
jgi:hypothetical protein